MKTLGWSLVILAVSILGSPGMLHSAEQTPTGRDVLKDCSLALDMAQEGYVEKLVRKGKRLPTAAQQNRACQCLSYIAGFKDALYVAQLFQEKNGSAFSICLPANNLNNKQALQIVIKYLKDNPQMLNRPQAAVIFNAFYYAFACKK